MQPQHRVQRTLDEMYPSFPHSPAIPTLWITSRDRAVPPLHRRNPNTSKEERGKSSQQHLLHHPGLEMNQGTFSLHCLPMAAVMSLPDKSSPPAQPGSRRHHTLFAGHSLSNTQHISQFLSLRAALNPELLPILALQSHFIRVEGPLPQLKNAGFTAASLCLQS